MLNVPSPVLEPVEIKSRDEAQAALAIISLHQISINRHLFRKQKIELLAQRRGKAIDELRAKQLVYDERLARWAKANRASEFGESKSLELRHGFLEFNSGRPAIKPLQGWTDEMVIRSMGRRKKWADCIRIKKEIDRQQIDKDFKREKLSKEDLAGVGLERKADEHFSISLKLSQ